ncbi:dihydroxyacetone kinase subunit DhaL [Novosphingobium sp. B 225]|uniref:dihydroxyacetone kinase subunit DhaL n=1 Tax=Novosphingobium sp. B 225 TaxID=1961849 RepID=UPI000B4A9209|nr:dihydroxyacetone kinase subunit DhaL [Novosphingobium sp. B 225]
MQTVTFEKVEKALVAIRDTALANEQYFCELDGVSGDGDFGTSLATGWREIAAKWDDLDRTSIGHLLLAHAQVIASKVGGCSGPIWGTAFMRAGMVARDKTSLSPEDIEVMFEKAIEGIKTRGGAEEGDKTLLDALAPMSRTFSATKAGDAVLHACLQTAEEAVESAMALQARRGRQSFTGERSIGSKDPGMVAIALMTRNIAIALSGHE